MDPVSLIVGALALGASQGVTDTAAAAVQDAYRALRGLVGRLFQGKPVAEAALDEHTNNPDGPHHEDDLKTQLERAGAAQDPEIIAAARKVMEAADPDGSRAGKYNLNLRGAQVGSIGDHNTNTTTFTYHPPAQP